MALPERLTVRSAYLYLVCLVTLVIALFAAVSAVRAAVELVYPDPGYVGLTIPAGGEVSEEELRRQEQRAVDSQRRQAVLGLVSSGTTLAIAGPVYLYHWRRVQSELATGDAAAPSRQPA